MSDSGGSNRTNRRVSARIACRLSTSYTTGSEWRPATCMDLSNAGCRLRLGEDLGRGAAITVRIESPEPDREPMRTELTGRVIWSRLEGLSYQVGTQFDSEDPGLYEILGRLMARYPLLADAEKPREGG
jgi:hypothetical protein